MEEMKQYSQCNYKRLKGHFDMETDPYQNVTGLSCDHSLKRHIFCLSINFVWQNQTESKKDLHCSFCFCSSGSHDTYGDVSTTFDRVRSRHAVAYRARTSYIWKQKIPKAAIQTQVQTRRPIRVREWITWNEFIHTNHGFIKELWTN